LDKRYIFISFNHHSFKTKSVFKSVDLSHKKTRKAEALRVIF